MRTTRECSSIWSCSGRGLPCRPCCQRRGALLPHLFTLTGSCERRRCIFCGAFRRLAPPRRYLAPCPVKPGLSSIPHGDTATVQPVPIHSVDCWAALGKWTIRLILRIESNSGQKKAGHRVRPKTTKGGCATDRNKDKCPLHDQHSNKRFRANLLLFVVFRQKATLFF